jgi:hypothetical protein
MYSYPEGMLEIANQIIAEKLSPEELAESASLEVTSSYGQ